MRIQNLTFETWKLNHPPDHNDLWCRELYPFLVFRRIDFGDNQINIEQKIELNRNRYYATIRKIELQENNRYKTTFDFYTIPTSKTQEWKQRKWETTFQIVYTTTFQFVTIFTKKEDPSKDFVVRFMKGNFQKIAESKSLPVSELLFRTLLLQLAEENFPNGEHNQLFSFDPEGVRKLPIHTQFQSTRLDFAPIYSIGRDLWICYAFNEEKAHRIAFYTAKQCVKMMVIYCNPTYTKHHRCKYDNTEILSLFEFANILSPQVKNRFENQIRFLQNHLNQAPTYNAERIKSEIFSPLKEIYEIQKSDLMEALGIMKILPQDNLDFFHSLTASNLINAFLSQQRKQKTIKSKEMNLFRDMYYFKIYLSNILTERITSGNRTVPIFIQSDLIMIEIYGFQFSFHSIPMNDILKDFENSSDNAEIVWTKKRLQPIAPLLLYYARALKQNNPIV